MSRLEWQTKPVLAPLLHGVPVKLNAESQTLIATWLIKTSIMLDFHYEKTRECYYTPEDCQSLKATLAIPPDTMMFLAQYNCAKADVITREFGMDLDPDKLPKTYHNMLELQAYAATFAIKHLALQVFSFRRPKHLSGEKLSVEIPDWSPAEVQIWPITSRSVSWPPPKLLDDAAFELFSDRWVDFSLLQLNAPP